MADLIISAILLPERGQSFRNGTGQIFRNPHQGWTLYFVTGPKYIIRVTDPSLSAEDAALGYKQLAEVERAFRTMKSQLDLRPVHHRLDDRIRAHVLLCWLALLLVRIIETETSATWEALRDELDEVMLTRISSKDGKVEIVSNLSPDQEKILKKLQLSQPRRIRKLAPTAQNL
jgi:transposase